MSGMMTARFLLHLREWDTKQTKCEVTTEDSGPVDFSSLEFSDPPERITSSGFVDDFGEDPVHRAEQNWEGESL